MYYQKLSKDHKVTVNSLPGGTREVLFPSLLLLETIETLEKGTYFTTFSSVSIVDIEQVNVSWVENVDDVLKKKPDCLIVHAGTNDLTD